MPKWLYVLVVFLVAAVFAGCAYWQYHRYQVMRAERQAFIDRFRPPLIPMPPPSPSQPSGPPSTVAYPLTMYDALNREVTIPRRPQRIISLAPAITETLYAIGAGDRLVADTDYCTYPEAAKALPHVGGYLDPSVEKITALKPDLILADRGTEQSIIDKLTVLGTPIYTCDPQTYDDVCGSIVTIGAAVDALPAANKVAGGMRKRRDDIVTRAKTYSSHPKVLFLMGIDGLYSAGPGSYIDDLITLAGGVNVAKATGKPWPELSMETVVSEDPAVILVLDGHGTKTVLTAESALATLRGQAKWRGISAVKHGRVAVLDDDLITIPGPRLADGLEAVAQAIHPAGSAGVSPALAPKGQ